MDEHTKDRAAFVVRQKKLGALKAQSRNKEGTLRPVRGMLMVATS